MIYSHLSKILPHIQNPIIIEAGAHIGTDTRRIISLLNRPFIYYAIEPDTRNIIRLSHIPDITVIPVALSNQSGKATFYLSQGLTSKGRQLTDCSSLNKPLPRHPANFTQTEIVTDTLDNRLSHLPYVTLLWADIQGGELAMIQGGSKVIAKTQYLYLESQSGKYYNQPSRRELIAVLPDFEVIYQDKSNIFLRNIK